MLFLAQDKLRLTPLTFTYLVYPAILFGEGVDRMEEELKYKVVYDEGIVKEDGTSAFVIFDVFLGDEKPSLTTLYMDIDFKPTDEERVQKPYPPLRGETPIFQVTSIFDKDDESIELNIVELSSIISECSEEITKQYNRALRALYKVTYGVSMKEIEKRFGTSEPKAIFQ